MAKCAASEGQSKVLMITRNLPPLVGGMERLNWHLTEELAKRAEVRVVGPRGAGEMAPTGVTIKEAPLKPLPRFLLRAQWAAIKQARRWQPDVILAGSGLTAPLAWLAAKTCGARTAVYLHGLDIALRNPLYRALWLPAMRRMDQVIANSHATKKLAIDAGVNPARIGIVHPGVELPREPADVQAARRFRNEHGLDERPLLLSVGRLTRRKGLREFVCDVLPRIIEHRSDVLFLIIGHEPADALHTENATRYSLQTATAAAGMSEYVRFLGRVSEPDLLVAYQGADVHVFPVLHIPGDPEGFGMVAIEAAAHGLPTVAYATGGVVDAVAEGQSGRLVEPGNYAAFADAVLQTLAERETLRTSCMIFAQRFAWPEFGKQVTALLSTTQMRTAEKRGAADA